MLKKFRLPHIESQYSHWKMNPKKNLIIKFSLEMSHLFLNHWPKTSNKLKKIKDFFSKPVRIVKTIKLFHCF